MTERINPDDTYSAADVQRIVFKRRGRWFSRHRAQLHAEGFPPPISKIGWPRWSGESLLAWQKRDVTPRDNSAAADTTNVVPWDQVLRDRARRLHPSRARRSESV